MKFDQVSEMSQKYPSMRLQAKGLNKLLQSWSDYFVILKPDVLELMKVSINC